MSAMPPPAGTMGSTISLGSHRNSTMLAPLWSAASFKASSISSTRATFWSGLRPNRNGIVITTHWHDSFSEDMKRLDDDIPILSEVFKAAGYRTAHFGKWHVGPDEEMLRRGFDHIATRVRRNAENLLVLSGEQAPRTWSEPVPLRDVLRAAIAETEDLSRVVIVVDEQTGPSFPSLECDHLVDHGPVVRVEGMVGVPLPGDEGVPDEQRPGTLRVDASQQYGNVPFLVTAPLGRHPLMAKIIDERIQYCVDRAAGQAEPCDVCQNGDGCLAGEKP